MRFVRCLNIFLALCLAGCALCALPASAQQTVSDPVVASSDSSSDSGVADAVMVGLIVTVVGILLWLGWKTDRERSKSNRTSSAQSMDDYEAWVATLNEDEPRDERWADNRSLGVRF